MKQFTSQSVPINMNIVLILLLILLSILLFAVTSRFTDQPTFCWSRHVPLLLFTVYITFLCSLLLFTILCVHITIFIKLTSILDVNALSCYSVTRHLLSYPSAAQHKSPFQIFRVCKAAFPSLKKPFCFKSSQRPLTRFVCKRQRNTQNEVTKLFVKLADVTGPTVRWKRSADVQK